MTPLPTDLPIDPDISPQRIQLILVVFSILFLINIGRLIVKGKLREEYAFVWIISTITIGIFSVWRDGVTEISTLLGIYYPPNLVFLGAILVLLLYILHLSIVVSGLQNKNKILAQEISLIKKQLEK